MMKKDLEEIREFKNNWKNYVVQSLFAAGVVFVLLIVANMEKSPILITSIGATAFIVFAMPHNVTASERCVVGGYVIGFMVGILFSLVPHKTLFFSAFLYSLAVGVSILLMVAFNAEHPPASGTALAFAIHGFHFKDAFTLLVSVAVLSFVHYLLKDHMRDIT